MGELLASFEAWDVQAIRREGIEKMIKALKTVAVFQEIIKQQLMEQYGMNEAEKKIELYW